MAAHAWTFGLTDLKGVPIGEITDMRDRQVVLPLSRVTQATFKVRLDNPRAATLVGGDCCLKGYRDGGLRFFGPLVSAEEVADNSGQSIACTFAGHEWKFAKRIVGKGTAGGGYKEGLSIAATGPTVDRIEISRQLIEIVNAEDFTGVATLGGLGGLSGTYGTSTATRFGPVFWSGLADCVASLAASDTGFDWTVTPREPSASGAPNGFPVMAQWNAASVIGGTANNVIFEYGDGTASIVGYNRAISNDGLMNWGGIQFPGFPSSSTKAVLIGSDATSIAARGRFEDTIAGSDLADDDLRQKLINAHIAVRKQRRQIITATIARDASPTPFTDYNIGDSVRLRVTVSGSVRFDVNVRVWGITFDIDNAGVETVTLEMVMP